METKIDIENFESQDFDTQKYVLTSPRSLRACNDLNIKVIYYEKFVGLFKLLIESKA